jgi:hypothetical protein
MFTEKQILLLFFTTSTLLIFSVNIYYAYADDYFCEGTLPDSYKGIAVYEIPYNYAEDNCIYGHTFFNSETLEIYNITIYTTGNLTFDRASYYHEVYHADHIVDYQNDYAPELYASQMVDGYTPNY